MASDETQTEDDGAGSALAPTALALYDIGPCSVTPIKLIETATFDVRTASGDRYCLRIHPPHSGEPAEIRSELLWLAALREEAGVAVPDPVHTRGAELLGTVRHKGDPAPSTCVLFRWVEGRPVAEEDLTPGVIKCMGSLLGRLHAYAEWWRPPPRFQREHLDVGVMGSPRFVGGGLASGFFLLGPGDDEVLWSAVRRVLAAMRELGEGRDVFGIVHGDPVPSNWLLHEDGVRLIDFDDCAWSYYLYDLALVLRALENYADFAILRAALLEGYRDARRLSAPHEAHLDTFLTMAHLVRVVRVLRNGNHPAYREWAPEFVRLSLETLRARIEAG